jgi:2-C-methyl-D-erythritol 4-phosphate cytidylyltransferase
VPDGIGLVAVHDAARGLAPADLVARTVEAVAGDVVAAAPALPVADTLKRVDGDTVVATVDRVPLVAVQTPQVFRVDVLRAAHEGDPDATDDLALVERAIADGRVTGRVVVVEGRRWP